MKTNKHEGEELIKIINELELIHFFQDFDDEITNEEYLNLQKLYNYQLVHSVGGGEGEGDMVQRIFYFEQWNTYLAFTGYYSSYHGTDWSNYIGIVKPVDRIVTVYTADLDADETVIKLPKNNIKII